MVPSEGVNLEGGKVLFWWRYSVRANSFRQSSEPRTSQPFLGWNRAEADPAQHGRDKGKQCRQTVVRHSLISSPPSSWISRYTSAGRFSQ